MNRRVLASLLATSLSAVGLMAMPAHAAPTCVVDNFTDVAGADSAGNRTLRFCLVNVDAAGSITFSTGGTDQVIELGGVLSRTGAVTIDGGAAVTVKPAAGQSIRLLSTDAGITILGMTFEGANLLTSGSGGAIDAAGDVTVTDSIFRNNSVISDGGAVNTSGNVTVTRSTFTGNNANDDGGAIWAGGNFVSVDSTYTNNVSGDNGGAVEAVGTAASTRDHFEGNLADDQGGAIRVELSYVGVGSTFINNEADDLEGGAIYSEGNVSTTSETYRGNFTDSAEDGGAIMASDANSLGSVTCSNSIFEENIAGDQGGAIKADEDYTGTSCTFTENSADDDGGAIFTSDDTTSTNDKFYSNSTLSSGGHGGAVYADDAYLTGAIFDGNTSVGDGGAMNVNGLVQDSGASLYLNNTSNTGAGGAIWAWSVDLTDTSFVSNRALAGDGGAIYADETDSVISRSYFGNNSAAVDGGALLAGENIQVSNSTFYSNSAAGDGGAIKSRTDTNQNGFIVYSTFVGNSAATAELVSWINDDLVLFGNLFLDHDANSLVDNGNGTNGIIDAGFNVSTATEASLTEGTSRTSISYASLGVGAPGTASTTSRPLVPISNFSNLSVQVTEDAVAAAQTATGLTFPTVDQAGTTRVFTFYPGAQLLKDAPPYVGPVVSTIGASPATMVITEKQQVSLRGIRLESISKALIDGKECEIVSAAEDELVIITPEGLSVGQFALVVFSDFGRLTIQDAFVVRESVTTATDGFKAWTKKQDDGSVKVYAKNVTGAGKVQFFVDGKEVAWVNDVDGTDPKLRLAKGSAYLVRTVSLDIGKNRFEIKVDGVRVWRATYSG